MRFAVKNLDVKVMGLGAVAADLKPKTDEDGELRLFDGKPAYSLNRFVVVLDADGRKRSDLYVSTLTPCDLPLGQTFELSGDVFVTPFKRGEFIAYALTCSALEPCDVWSASDKETSK